MLLDSFLRVRKLLKRKDLASNSVKKEDRVATFAPNRSIRLSLKSWPLVALAALAFAAPAVAQLTTGDVLAGVGAGKIKRFTPAGVLQQTLDSTTASNETTGMCFDTSSNLFGTMFTANTVTKFNNLGTVLVANFGTGYNSSPESCVIDASGNLYFGQANGARLLHKVSPSGTTITDFTPTMGPRGTDWIDLEPDQCTMHYTSEGNIIRRFNVCTSTQGADFATGLPGSTCYAHRIRPNGEELVACTSVANRVSAAGVVLQTYTAFSPSPGQLFALNLDPDGTTFWTGDLGSGQVYHMNITTGAQVTSWNAGILGGSMAGLAVVGEIVVSQPTPTPGNAATPTPRITVPSNIPTLAPPTMAVLGLLLAALGVLLMRRTR